MDLDQQLLTSLLHDINWGPLDQASCGPQLMSCNMWCVCVCRCACVVATNMGHMHLSTIHYSTNLSEDLFSEPYHKAVKHSSN